MDKLYIHYGSNQLIKDKVTEMKREAGSNMYINKPDFGLWGSPVDCEFGWKEWCESEDFRTDTLDRYFVFKVKDGDKIFTVRKNDDVSDYLYTPHLFTLKYMFPPKYIDFDKIMKEYDGMELIHGDNYMDLHYGYFYSWDVDSIVVWNPDVIEVVRKHPQKLHILR